MKNLFLKIIDKVMDNPKTVMALFIIVPLIMLTQFPKVKIDTDPENMLSHDDPVRIAHDEIKADFMLHEAIIVGIVNEKNPEKVFSKETLERLYRITKEIEKIDGVIERDILSLATTDDIEGSGGTLNIEPLLSSKVKSDKAGELIKERALENPVIKDLIVSADGKALIISVPVKSKDLSYKIMEEIKLLIEKDKGNETFLFAGLPVAEDTFGVEMFKQMSMAAPAAGLLIFILLIIFFKKPVLSFSAMIVAMTTVIITMGFLITFGFTVHIMISMIPIFLMPIAVVDSIHILSEFHDRFKGADTKRETIRQVMEELYAPMFFTSLTSAIGFFSLMLTPIPPVKVFGAFVGFGIFLAWALTVIFIPAFIMLLSDKRFKDFGVKADENKGGLINFIRTSLGSFAIKRAKFILPVAIIIVAVSIVGITKTTVNDNPVKWFEKDHPIRVADTILNTHFGGTYMTYLVLESKDEGAIKNPQNLEYIENLQKGLLEIDNVGKTTAITDVLKKIKFEIMDRAEGSYSLPETNKQSAQFIFLYEMSGDVDDLYHLIDPNVSSANIWVQLKSGDNKDMVKVIEGVDKYFEDNPLPTGFTYKWGGLPYINVTWQDKMVKGMLSSLAGSAVVVLLIMSLLFRSFIWGIISMIPLSVTIIFIYGLVGFTGKDYDMPIAVLSSLTLGISVDFAIHFVQRSRQIFSEGLSFEDAMAKLYDEPVRAILRNIVVIAIGFLPLLLSPLLPYKTVGIFFATIMLVSGLSTLLILAAIITVFNKKLKFETN